MHCQIAQNKTRNTLFLSKCGLFWFHVDFKGILTEPHEDYSPDLFAFSIGPLLLLPENKAFGIRTNISNCNNQDKMIKHHNSHWFHKLYHLVCSKSEPQQPYMKLSCTIMCLGVHLKIHRSTRRVCMLWFMQFVGRRCSYLHTPGLGE